MKDILLEFRIFKEELPKRNDFFLKKAYTIANLWTQIAFKFEETVPYKLENEKLTNLFDLLTTRLKERSPLRQLDPIMFRNFLIISMVTFNKLHTIYDFHPGHILSHSLSLFSTEDYSFAFPWKTSISDNYKNDNEIVTFGFGDTVPKSLPVIEDLDVEQLRHTLLQQIEKISATLKIYEPLELKEEFQKTEDITDLVNFFSERVILKMIRKENINDTNEKEYILNDEFNTFSSGQKGIMLKMDSGHTSITREHYKQYNIYIKALEI